MHSKSKAGEKYGTQKNIKDYYVNLAKQAIQGNDWPTAHYYFQYAEHYKRLNKHEFL